MRTLLGNAVLKQISKEMDELNQKLGVMATTLKNFKKNNHRNRIETRKLLDWVADNRASYDRLQKQINDLVTLDRWADDAEEQEWEA